MLYGLNLRAKVALKFDKKGIEELLKTASEDQLLKLLDALE